MSRYVTVCSMSRFVTVSHGLSQYLTVRNEFESRPAKNGNTSPRGSWMRTKFASSFAREKTSPVEGSNSEYLSEDELWFSSGETEN